MAISSSALASASSAFPRQQLRLRRQIAKLRKTSGPRSNPRNQFAHRALQRLRSAAAADRRVSVSNV